MNRGEALRLLSWRQRGRAMALALRGWRFACAHQYHDDETGFSIVWAVLVRPGSSVERWIHPDGSSRCPEEPRAASLS